jgi:hypothetical protein
MAVFVLYRGQRAIWVEDKIAWDAARVAEGP